MIRKSQPPESELQDVRVWDSGDACRTLGPQAAHRRFIFDMGLDSVGSHLTSCLRGPLKKDSQAGMFF